MGSPPRLPSLALIYKSSAVGRIFGPLCWSHVNLIPLRGGRRGESTAKEMGGVWGAGCWQEVGSGARAIRTRWNLPEGLEAISVPGSCPCPLSPLAQPKYILHSSCFNSSPSPDLCVHPEVSGLMSPLALLNPMSHGLIETSSGYEAGCAVGKT